MDPDKIIGLDTFWRQQGVRWRLYIAPGYVIPIRSRISAWRRFWLRFMGLKLEKVDIN